MALQRVGVGPIRPRGSEAATIQWASHPFRALLHHVRVDHRRLHVRLTQQLLHRVDIVATLQQVGGEAMARRVAAGRLGDARAAHRQLHVRLVPVIAYRTPRIRIPARNIWKESEDTHRSEQKSQSSARLPAAVAVAKVADPPPQYRRGHRGAATQGRARVPESSRWRGDGTVTIGLSRIDSGT